MQIVSNLIIKVLTSSKPDKHDMIVRIEELVTDSYRYSAEIPIV
jgi:hypothetical protein